MIAVKRVSASSRWRNRCCKLDTSDSINHRSQHKARHCRKSDDSPRSQSPFSTA
jgi:hypothetical protein